MRDHQTAPADHLPAPVAVQRQTIFQRRPTCKELFLFPTPIVWALIFGGTNYDACPAIPHATLTIIACSSVTLLNETVRFVFRIPLAPWEEPRSLLVWLCTFLQAATLGFACWGAVLTFPQAARFTQAGGEGCNTTAFSTAFLCSALTLLSYVIIALVLAYRWCARRHARTLDSVSMQNLLQVPTHAPPDALPQIPPQEEDRTVS